MPGTDVYADVYAASAGAARLTAVGDLSRHAVARATGVTHDGSIQLTVIVPAFNEAERLPALLSDLRHHVDIARTEVVVVDDGSTDATVEVARGQAAWSPHLRILEHGANRGKGAAVRTGVQAARGRLVAFVDADNATDLRALQPMCERIVGEIGAVFGSRHAPGASVTGSPPIRGVMGRIFNHVVRLAAGTTISDTQCGAKVFWTPVARVVFSGSAIDGFAFDVEIVRRLKALRVQVVEHPVAWHYVSGSKIRLLTPARMLVDIVKLRLVSDGLDLPVVTATWTDPARDLIDPLWPGGSPTNGQTVRVLLPEDGPGLAAVRSMLADAGAQPR